MIKKQCPLLEKCRKASGIDCTDRNFDGNQPSGNMKWLGKEPCTFYLKVVSDSKKKLIHSIDRK